MKQVILDIGLRKQQHMLKLHFPYDRELINLAQKAGAGWSQSLGCWYLPFTKSNVNRVKAIFKGKARIDAGRLKAHLANPRVALAYREIQLSRDILDEIQAFGDWMRNKRYSESTIKTYMESLKVFFRFLENPSPQSVTNQDLERFEKDYIIAGHYSVASQSQMINGVKLFFSNRQNRKLEPESIDRPKKAKKLPNVLSKEEVKRILEAHKNLKHRAMLSLIYACGLRRNELLNLKPTDVDSNRKVLVIREAKGRKDRIVPISDNVIALLRKYYKHERPTTYLFEGQKPGSPLSEGSLQKVLKGALKKAGIEKPVTLHWLRHSYATHLLESGTDLRYIQEILGHKSSKTTEIYTHVTNQSIMQIKTPFDDL